MSAIHLLFLSTFFFYSISSNGQSAKQSFQLNYKQLIIPAALITYGAIGMENQSVRHLNTRIKREVTANVSRKITVDDFCQYVPAITVYGLNLADINGKHNLKERNIILATSYILMVGTVLSIKSISGIERPDGANHLSFPSGHTATAFVGAELLWQEYKDVSIWYGITGYSIAAGTGFFRMYNNKH